MRLAFDVDDTLVPRSEHFPTESSFLLDVWPLFFPERVREGTCELFQSLKSEQHELWLYTTSVRGPYYLKMWFLMLGVSIDGVVNHDIHTEMMRNKAAAVRDATKYPPAFGIDLLFDHSWGIVAEGQMFDYPVVRIDPTDVNWTQTVKQAVERKAREPLAKASRSMTP